MYVRRGEFNAILFQIISFLPHLYLLLLIIIIIIVFPYGVCMHVYSPFYCKQIELNIFFPAIFSFTRIAYI